MWPALNLFYMGFYAYDSANGLEIGIKTSNFQVPVLLHKRKLFLFLTIDWSLILRTRNYTIGTRVIYFSSWLSKSTCVLVFFV